MIELIQTYGIYILGGGIALFVAWSERRSIPGIAKLVMPKSSPSELRHEIAGELMEIADRIRATPLNDKDRGDAVQAVGSALIDPVNCKRKADPIE